ncbi:hypothetical protein SAMN06265827_1284 [Orenia metallireducens]|uniref:Uncharacterized protein n=1 Tax=Orenia metallireducens TaxID=1413210 RepID=A0A285HZI4_9FIRM|nr:hypothetical protein SAMN06265827_1284 [Orenia metallireducens]
MKLAPHLIDFVKGRCLDNHNSEYGIETLAGLSLAYRLMYGLDNHNSEYGIETKDGGWFYVTHERMSLDNHNSEYGIETWDIYNNKKTKDQEFR